MFEYLICYRVALSSFSLSISLPPQGSFPELWLLLCQLLLPLWLVLPLHPLKNGGLPSENKTNSKSPHRGTEAVLISVLPCLQRSRCGLNTSDLCSEAGWQVDPLWTQLPNSSQYLVTFSVNKRILLMITLRALCIVSNCSAHIITSVYKSSEW